jgi:Spy/CpxP family protein refolding chaperone
MNHSPSHRPSHTHAPRSPLLLRGVALAAALCIGGIATYAVTARPAFAAGLDAAPWMQHLHGRSHAELHAHVQQVLTRAGATDAQKQQIDAIVRDAMQAQHADMARYHASLARMKTLLTAAQVDTAEVERVRSEQDALLLDTNRRLTETLLRAAKVLTPAQRSALGAEIDRMMASPLGHHHGE